MSEVLLSSLSLFPATKIQIREARARTYRAWGASWGEDTTLEDYLRHDEHVDNLQVSRDNRLVTWVLAPRDAPESLDFLCSCETFRRDGLIARTSGSAYIGQNTVTQVNCYAVATVFTLEEHRGKGYARHMLQLLHWIIGRRDSLRLDQFPAEWGAPPSRPDFITDGYFSVIYSDVGSEFYYMAGPTLAGGDGWKVVETISTLWDVPKAPDCLSSANVRAFDWRWLNINSIHQAFDADAQFIWQELTDNQLPLPIAFSFLPNHGMAEFQYQRLEKLWKNVKPTPTEWGISAVKDSELDISTFATWTLNYRPPLMNRLIITRLRSSPEGFESLLFQIIDYAKRHLIDEVEVWGLSDNLKAVAQLTGGKTFDRDDHLPSFKWYGLDNPKYIFWAYNEKFCWC